MSLARFSVFAALVLAFAYACAPSGQDQLEQSRAEAQLSVPTDTATVAEEDTVDVFDPLHPWRISPYDKIVKKFARRYGFDWRLISAQIYAESRFRPDVVSHRGAVGLMQVMPSTARHFNVDPSVLLRPEDNIALGCYYDRWLYELWKGPPERDRLAFMFASYNAGRRAILRAHANAPRKYRWSAVEPLVPGETRHYVRKIFRKYEEYKQRVF